MDEEKNSVDPSQPHTASAVSRSDQSPTPESPSEKKTKYAWLQVLGSFILLFNSWGTINAFGVYQTYYESGARFHTSSSGISWIGSLQSFLLMATGLVAGPIYDRGYLRTLVLTGSFLLVFGHMMLSICNRYWQIILVQGIIFGVGTGCLFVPSLAVLPQYYRARLGLATGIAQAGSAFGGVIYPIVLSRLISQIGFGWAVRTVGFIVLTTLLIPITVSRLRFTPPKVRDIVDWTALIDAGYMSFVISSLIAFTGLFGLLFYFSFYAANLHITDKSMAFYLVSIFNAGSCIGRILINAISDKIGSFNVVAPASIITSVLVFCLIAVKHEGAMITVTILAGFFTGGILAMPSVCFNALTKDKSKLGTRMGMGFAIMGTGIFAGGPGSGAILGSHDPLNWRDKWIFSGVGILAGGFGFVALRVIKYGFKVKVKA